MASSKLSPELFSERPEPASPVRGAQAQSPNPDPEGKPRRRPSSTRPSSTDDQEDEAAPDTGGKPQHKVDSLA